MLAPPSAASDLNGDLAGAEVGLGHFIFLRFEVYGTSAEPQWGFRRAVEAIGRGETSASSCRVYSIGVFAFAVTRLFRKKYGR